VVGFAPNGDYRRASHFRDLFDRSVIALGADDSIYLGGSFTGSADFDPAAGTVERQSGFDADGQPVTSGYLVKLGADGVFRWVQIFKEVPIGAVGGLPDGALATGLGPAGLTLMKLDAGGNSIFSLSSGNLNTFPWAIATGSGQFVMAGATDGLADFDPGPGTDVVDRGHVSFASRYAF
jgi:hypothetical protein